MDKYQSPFSTRYEDETLSRIWSHRDTRLWWRRAWLTLLEYQKDLIFPNLSEKARGTLTELFEHGTDKRSLFLTSYSELEKTIVKGYEEITKHDLVAELIWVRELFGEEIGPYVHMGTTSSNIQDFALAQQSRLSQLRIGELIDQMMYALIITAIKHKKTVIMGKTHLQNAEPTTLGFRLSFFVQQIDLFAKKAKTGGAVPFEHFWEGAVGTDANNQMLSEVFGWEREKTKDIRFQTLPRNRFVDWAYEYSNLACILHKLALDMRLMHQSPAFNTEFDPYQVGSSAMPGKRNPIKWEKVCGLTRRVPLMAQELWQISANSGLERTLDDSAPLRSLLPELHLLMAEIIKTTTQAIKEIDPDIEELWYEVFTNWKSWIPSRVQTLQAKLGIKMTRKEMEKAIKSSNTLQDFLLHTLREDFVSALPTEENWLFLGEAERKMDWMYQEVSDV